MKSRRWSSRSRSTRPTSTSLRMPGTSRSAFTTITRSHSDEATSDPDEIVLRALALLEKTDAGRRPVRLLGAGVYNLEPLGGREEAAESGAQLRLEESGSV